MKKIILTIFIFSFLYNAFAGIKGEEMLSSKAKKTVTDTIPFVIDEDEMADYNDSIISFPSSDLYCGWDTINTHSIKFDIESLKEDTKEIALYDKNSCGYVHPFSGNVTSGFGPRKRRFHYGADIDLETGDAVGSAFDGKVRIARKSKSYGSVVVIRHSNGLETYYAHLSKINVEVGQEVFAGEIIGLGGNTGHSRGSHLHFEVRYLGHPINPTEIISFTDQRLVADTFCISKKTFNYVCEAKKAAGKTYANSKNKIHIVKKGDTLYAIARKYKTTPKELSKKNRIKSTQVLRLGQKIKL
ncbi:MAG: M23 family metallopeptidase [Bacteroidia bacterium]|nr:M23 family metallopeptidase [Bacteroidia bacterium]